MVYPLSTPTPSPPALTPCSSSTSSFPRISTPTDADPSTSDSSEAADIDAIDVQVDYEDGVEEQRASNFSFRPGTQKILHVKATHRIVKVAIRELEAGVTPSAQESASIDQTLQTLLPPLLVHLTTVPKPRLMQFVVDDETVKFHFELMEWPWGKKLRYSRAGEEPVPTWGYKLYITPLMVGTEQEGSYEEE